MSAILRRKRRAREAAAKAAKELVATTAIKEAEATVRSAVEAANQLEKLARQQARAIRAEAAAKAALSSGTKE